MRTAILSGLLAGAAVVALVAWSPMQDVGSGPQVGVLAPRGGDGPTSDDDVAQLAALSTAGDIETTILRAWGSARTVGGPSIVQGSATGNGRIALDYAPGMLTVYNSGDTTLTINTGGDTFVIPPGSSESRSYATVGNAASVWSGNGDGTACRFVYVLRHQAD